MSTTATPTTTVTTMRDLVTPFLRCARRQDAGFEGEHDDSSRDPTIDTRPTATPVPGGERCRSNGGGMPLGEPLANRSVETPLGDRGGA